MDFDPTCIDVTNGLGLTFAGGLVLARTLIWVLDLSGVEQGKVAFLRDLLATALGGSKQRFTARDRATGD